MCWEVDAPSKKYQIKPICTQFMFNMDLTTWPKHTKYNVFSNLSVYKNHEKECVC